MSATTSDELRAAVLGALLDVAPDIEPDTLDSTKPIREQFDFDSMDQLNFVVGLHRRLGVDVPETDYPQLATLDGCIAYVTRALRTGTGS